MKKSATIKDIASRLGLSASTVSRSLSGMPGVDPMTREAVQDLANALNYRPNLTAVRQVRKQSHIIGVIIPSFTIYFYSEALSGMHEAATKEGYNLMICQTSESFEEEKKCVDLLLSSRMDGLITSISRETTDFQHLEKVIKRGMPVILFNRVCDIPASKVTVDDYKGAFEVTQHLLDQKSTRLAHISGPTKLEITQNRLRGYTDAMKEAGMTVEEAMVVVSDFTAESGYECAGQLFAKDNPPDAIFCVCDAVAYGVLEYARDHGIHVPDQLKLAGFTDEPHAKRLRPQLTTVHQPIFDIGKQSVQLLIEQIKNPKADPQHREMATDLKVRASSTTSDLKG